MTQLEELTDLAAQIRKRRKTKLPEAEFHSATSLATAVLKDASVDLTTVLETLDTFPAPVIAETAKQCWDDLTPQRRAVFVRWISRREGDRAPKRIIYSAARILGHDSATSVELLSGVIPQNENLSQEMKADLRRAFAADRGADLALLTSSQLSQESVGRFFHALLQSLDMQTPFASKVAVTKAAMQVAARRRISDPVFVSIVSAVDSQVRTWPSDARTEFARYLQSVSPDLMGSLHFEVATTDSTVKPPAVLDRTKTEVPLEPTHAPPSRDVSNWLLQRINNTKSELDVLLKLQERLREVDSLVTLRERVDCLERELRHKSELLDAEIAKVADFHRKLLTVETDKQRLEAEATTKNTELGLAREESSRLGAQITAHENIAVDEFKNRLGATLSKLITDLPDRSAEINVDRSQFLLRQYHQFIDMLESNGVAVRRKRGAA
jgi:hypothetical protein